MGARALVCLASDDSTPSGWWQDLARVQFLACDHDHWWCVGTDSCPTAG